MELTQYSDYALRTLIYLSTRQEPSTISDIAERYDISRNHLVKIVHNLSKKNYVHTTRGRGGGIMLNVNSMKTPLGDFLQEFEPHFNFVECFSTTANTCCLSGICKLQTLLFDARKAFFDSLNAYTLSDIVQNQSELRSRFQGKE